MHGLFGGLSPPPRNWIRPHQMAWSSRRTRFFCIEALAFVFGLHGFKFGFRLPCDSVFFCRPLGYNVLGNFFLMVLACHVAANFSRPLGYNVTPRYFTPLSYIVSATCLTPLGYNVTPKYFTPLGYNVTPKYFTPLGYNVRPKYFTPLGCNVRPKYFTSLGYNVRPKYFFHTSRLQCDT